MLYKKIDRQIDRYLYEQIDKHLIVCELFSLRGLLGGHVVSLALKKEGKGMAWYNGELLDMAIDIADRLLVAFNTTTGIPYSRVSNEWEVIKLE